MHSFDDALALQADGPDCFLGRTTDQYWNMMGPFGGVTAAVLLNAVLQHPEVQGEPLSLTVNFAAPVPRGAFRLLVRPVRTNRATQHWLVEQQVTHEGETSVASTAVVVMAQRRDTWSGSDCPAPLSGGPAAGMEPVSGDGFPAWFRNFEMVMVEGGLPQHWDGSERPGSRSRFWIRCAPRRTLDFACLATFCDTFMPGIWLRRARQVAVATVSMTVYFHAGSAQLQAGGGDYVLAQGQGQEYRNAFGDQRGQIWDRQGLMLASTHQIVYYRE